jgi:hypothetical protein
MALPRPFNCISSVSSHFSLVIRVAVGKVLPFTPKNIYFHDFLWHLLADLSVFRCKKCFRGGHLPLFSSGLQESMIDRAPTDPSVKRWVVP